MLCDSGLLSAGLADRRGFVAAIKAIQWLCVSCVAIFGVPFVAAAETTELAAQYRDAIQPILKSYCFDCHADGSAEGDLAFDTATSDDELVGNRQLWWAVLKNVRAGIMPPSDAEQPSVEAKQKLTDWIKVAVFGVDPEHLDPGRVTVRRLNRAEYRNTIRDLMGVDFNAEVVFPPDDTGFGFDNVGDVLSLSPLLLEKYLQAATTIVQEAVPTVCKVLPVQGFTGKDFSSESADDDTDGSRMSYKESRTVTKLVRIDKAGKYRLRVQVKLHGSFEFDPSQCRVKFSANEEELFSAEYAWDESKKIDYQFERDFAVGEQKLSFQLVPLNRSQDSPPDDEEENGNTYNNFYVEHVDVEGPIDTDVRVHPANYERFFPRDEPPASPADRREYAREVLAAFAERAYRRPADAATLDKLVAVAEFTYQQPEETFESGIAQAMTAILASPRFLFRLEAPAATDDGPFPQIDEHSLASRLSYFLWSTMPDGELFRLANAGALRQNLDAQVERMLKDDRSESFVQNFVGQWLRSRDVEHVSLDPLVALGYGEEYEQLRDVFRRRFRRRENAAQDTTNDVSDEEWEKARARFSELREIRDKFDSETRRAMRRETEMLFEYIVREDRSVLELLDSDYTFLNEKLADLYDIPGVEGREMRRVVLPDGSPRGGVLTQGTMLTTTSNPTRTSPVKRGLYILDNILGTPSPPAPPNVPELEEATKRFGDREPPLRELLAAHREAALCSSCHNRMDPLGIALENFNALGMWRETEHGEPIDASGTLVTGEAFEDIRTLKQILVTEHRADFYRCMTQKLMIYALGRGLEYYDEYTVDQIVDRVAASEGKFSVLMKEVVNSTPFQRQRIPVVVGKHTSAN